MAAEQVILRCKWRNIGLLPDRDIVLLEHMLIMLCQLPDNRRLQLLEGLIDVTHQVHVCIACATVKVSALDQADSA